jgi:hypothetical protein
VFFRETLWCQLILFPLQPPEHLAVWLKNLSEPSNKPDSPIHELFFVLGAKQRIFRNRENREKENIATEGRVILLNKYHTQKKKTFAWNHVSYSIPTPHYTGVQKTLRWSSIRSRPRCWMVRNYEHEDSRSKTFDIWSGSGHERKSVNMTS